ncbi:GNAT family N-acetyltransferase [Agrococcus sp. 1P02AA]|uniref:GNAT family N-acetyltransferase n=1 Tax=Agrococcus sp. 1P02AA TaxID=3132259 RepID=UPI0039A4FF15
MLTALDLPCELELPRAPSAGYRLRRATQEDLPALVALLADDALAVARGETAEPSASAAYAAALAEVLAEPSNELVVAVDAGGRLAATMQLTRIPGLARRGATRLQIEAVRVDAEHRSSGLGTAMLRWAMGPAAVSTGSALVQLTSDERRPDAHRFYERLGFVGSHRGFKRQVEQGR